MNLQLKELFREFNNLQLKHGSKKHCAIFGAGKINSPKVCLVFMNPTARNISSEKIWKGIRAPWVGTKNIWKMLSDLELIDKKLAEEILSKKPVDWNENFAKKVYEKVAKNNIYITNLSKATQIDAKPLSDKIFKEYLELFRKEIDLVKPKIIITFGNQVSSIILKKNISVSKYRKKREILKINNRDYKMFPVYYPVGQGMPNMSKAKEDIKWILKNN